MRFPSWTWEDRSSLASSPQAPLGLKRAFGNGFYAVQWFEQSTEWGLVVHLVITRQVGAASPQPRSWADLQRIKNEIVGEDRAAVEVFPTVDRLIDQADVYHLWVLPKGFQLPFDLQNWCQAGREGAARR